MKETKKIIIILLFCINFVGCERNVPILPSNELPIEFEEDYLGIDLNNKIIIYNGNSTEINDETVIIGDFIFNVETTDKELSIGKEYTVNDDDQVYKLFLTELPIVLITTFDIEIVDEPKVRGKVKISETGKEPFTSFIGVELRGGASQSYPKKTYSLELWKSENGDTKERISLMGMRVDDDWILDGMWNEPNRIRDFTSHDLWLDMGRVQNSNKDTKIGINRKYCELFLNGRYKGVYYLSEKIDRKQLDLDKYNNQIEGELYKGYTWANGVSFTGVDEFDNSLLEWSGYEAKYPGNLGKVDWSKLHEHVDFIVKSSQLSFNNLISSKIDMINAIDYYIFLNLIYATDNTGKNLFTCRFNKSSLYFFVPWDMDGTFGNNWEGERYDITSEMLSNGLYDKLLNYSYFRGEVKKRWSELRVNTLTTDNIKQMFRDNYEYLERNGVYKREALVSGISQNYSNNEIDFLESWIDRRVLFLNVYFNNL